uniref:Sushi domain-containing protein n=1 Tax=Oncorhynchus tshawytscha TaxID=74940 RepID=A0A8C8IMH1_ONCTS
ERRRTCPKPCTQDKDCGNKRQCLCDGQCGLSCVAPGRTCPWPLPSGNSFVASLLSPTPSFSALLEVRCDTGYMLPNGLDAAIPRCQGDRQWSSDDPDCTALGHDLVGNSENLCNIDQTWQYPHVCICGCGARPPQEVNQGYLVAVQRTEYDVSDAIYYLCKKNHVLDGPNRVTCQPNGTWRHPDNSLSCTHTHTHTQIHLLHFLRLHALGLNGDMISYHIQ